MSSSAKTVLDIGFGTGTLTAKLYEYGCMIYGQDFSDRMIQLAQAKMPTAALFKGDFSKGLVKPLLHHNYDAIIATYSLHHLTDEQKINFLNSLLIHLNQGGCIYIGDVVFETRAALEKCKNASGSEWDDDEIYFVFEEFKNYFPSAHFAPMSNCAGLISLQRLI